MAAGYTGQLVALDVNTPTEEQQSAAQASGASSLASVEAQTVPDQIALRRQQVVGAERQNQAMSIANQSNQLNLDDMTAYNVAKNHYLKQVQAARTAGQIGGQSSSPLASSLASSSQQLFDPRIQQLMRGINTSDPGAESDWDDALRNMSDEVPQAKQFIGQYSPANVKNWLGQMGAHAVNNAGTSPLAAGSSAPSPLSDRAQPTASISPITGQADPDIEDMSIINPDAAGKFVSMQGMMKYRQTGDPTYLQRYAPNLYKDLTDAQKNLSETQKISIATKMGTMGQKANAVLSMAHDILEKKGDPQRSPEVRSAYNELVISSAKQGWITPQAAQKALINPKMDFGTLAYLQTQAMTVAESLKTSGVEAGNEAAAKAPFDGKYQYIGNVNGNAGTLNVRTGQINDSGVAVGAKPSAMSDYFDHKQQVAINAGMSPADAAEFANGKKALSDVQIRNMALQATERDAATAALTGAPFDKNAALQQNLSALQASAPSPHAPTPTQSAAVRQFAASGRGNPKAAIGSQGNPAVPTNQVQFDRLPSGSWYIYHDGSLKHKP